MDEKSAEQSVKIRQPSAFIQSRYNRFGGKTGARVGYLSGSKKFLSLSDWKADDKAAWTDAARRLTAE